MDHNVISLLSLIAMGIGIWWWLSGLALRSKMKTIKKLPLSSTGSVELGNIKIDGMATAIKPMTARFSQKDCIYCAWKVEKMMKRIFLAWHWWSDVDEGKQCGDFYLDDGTGKLLVHLPKSVRFYGPSKVWDDYWGGEGQLPPGAKEWLTAKTYRNFRSCYRFTETLLESGARAFIVGKRVKIKDSLDGVAAGEIIVMGGFLDGRRLLVSAESEDRLLADWAWKIPWKVRGGAFVAAMGFAVYLILNLPLFFQ